MNDFIVGTIITSPRPGELTVRERGAIALEGGSITAVLDALPVGASPESITDLGNAIIVPSFGDMHLHAPQYPMLGLGMDLPLIEWLNKYTFKTEAMFSDPQFARRVYAALADELISLGTTRVVMFSSIHTDSTFILMEELERAGVTGYVGKVSMDRNGGDVTESTEGSLSETRRFIEGSLGRFAGLSPIITPRFTPACTDALMEGLGGLSTEFSLPVQSHLSENNTEIEWVKELCPDCPEYWDSYARFGLWKKRTVMAHCVHSSPREREAIAKAGVWVAHCPDSNTNIYSGIAPVRRMLREGLDVALGSDIAGGASLSMLHTAASAIRASKLRYYYSGFDESERFLTVAEAFYLLSSAPRRFFGLPPEFAPGEKLHAVALSDEALPPSRELTPPERLERLIYADDKSAIKAVWSEGVRRK